VNKFKIEDFKVGDKVTLIGAVSSVDLDDETLPLKVELMGGESGWVGLDEIMTHERGFMVGDRVKDISGYGENDPSTVLGVDGDQLWLKADGGARWTDDAKDFEIVS
jgi:hypothetical protein